MLIIQAHCETIDWGGGDSSFRSNVSILSRSFEGSRTRCGGKKKNERTSPEWGALCYHGNSADVRACIMWLLIDSVEEWANKTGTITHTQGDGQSSGYTHTSVCTRTHTYTKSTNKSIYIYTWPTHSNGSILNEKKTADDGLEEHFYNQAC